MQENEQALFLSCTGVRSTQDGPGLACYPCCSSVSKRGAQVLENGYYVLTTNDENGERSVYLGEQASALGGSLSLLF